MSMLLFLNGKYTYKLMCEIRTKSLNQTDIKKFLNCDYSVSRKICNLLKKYDLIDTEIYTRYNKYHLNGKGCNILYYIIQINQFEEDATNKVKLISNNL
jgi:predicted transcriptional regulator